MQYPQRYPIMLSIVLSFILASCGATAQPTSNSTPLPKAAQTINGVVLPPDAAPPEQQVFVVHFGKRVNLTTLNFFESVYSRFTDGPTINDLFSEPLMRINKNYQIEPAAATKWEIDPAGTTWTFQLDPNLIWNDDTPVTAEDYAATFRYGADPKHKWDFSWFFNGVIKNWEEVASGKLPLDQLGVQALNAHTLQIETVAPAPYLTSMLIYSTPFQKKALEKYGTGLYNTNPATAVSSGPFVLKKWKENQYFVLEANPKYTGSNKPYIQKIIATKNENDSFLSSYLANEIDYVETAYLTEADHATIEKDPDLLKQRHINYGDFATHYLFFDLQNPPFNNLKVRQAFSHVIDRNQLIKEDLKPINGIAAYSYLTAGFPAANPSAYKNIQNYDVAKAKQLLAEAGYPDGKGFPKLTMWMRQNIPAIQATAESIAQAIKQHLNIEVEVASKPRQEFNDALNAKPTKIQFGFISYGMDFLDPYNMLSVWLSGGRHNWTNASYDALVKKAGAFTGERAERIKLFQQAERILIEDVGGVFVFHRIGNDIFRPYLVGSELEPDDVGIAGFHFPGISSGNALIGSMYISKEVLKYRKGVPQEPTK